MCGLLALVSCVLFVVVRCLLSGVRVRCLFVGCCVLFDVGVGRCLLFGVGRYVLYVYSILCFYVAYCSSCVVCCLWFDVC